MSEQENWNWIIENRLAIGNHLAAKSADMVARHGFKSLINLNGAISIQQAMDLGYEDFFVDCWIDGPGNNEKQVQMAFEAFVDMAQNTAPVLVTCHAGRSRSASLVATYLAYSQAITLDAAKRQIALRREIDIQAGLLDLMKSCLARS